MVCDEYLIETIVINKPNTFVVDDIFNEVKRTYSKEVDTKTIQKVLSSYITDGILDCGERGYKVRHSIRL